MEIIILSDEQISILAQKTGKGISFIRESLYLTGVDELDEESYAETIREAEEEQLEAEDCCDETERAAFRKWIELATGNEKELLRVLERIGDCEESENERMLAVRGLAEMMV